MVSIATPIIRTGLPSGPGRTLPRASMQRRLPSSRATRYSIWYVPHEATMRFMASTTSGRSDSGTLDKNASILADVASGKPCIR